jgi:hypothetical protein
MVLCIIGLVVFAVLGVFSAKYRALAKEAFRCVFRMATLRPCDTDFDRKIKMKLVGKLMGTHKGIAGLLYKNFDALSWAFTLLFFVSLLITAQSVYNLVVYGTCDPVTNVCLFAPHKPECNCVEGITCDPSKPCGPGCTCLNHTCQGSRNGI